MTKLNNFISKGDFLAVKNIIENEGYSPNYTGWHGLTNTPLYTATFFQNREIVDYLIQKGADVNARGQWNWGKSALEVALDNKCTPVVASLLEANAQIPHKKYSSDAVKNYMKTKIVSEYLIRAASENDSASIVKILKNEYANINESYLDRDAATLTTPLQTAVIANHLEVTSTLLEKGALIPVCEPDTWNMHPLNLASDPTVLELLIKHTPLVPQCLFGATLSGKEQLIEMLHKNDWEDIMSKESRTIEALVENAAKASADSTNSTPLQFAVEQDKLEGLEILIELGSDLTDKNALNGQTALALSVKESYTNAVNMLTIDSAEFSSEATTKSKELNPIVIKEVLTLEQIITPVGQDIQAIQKDNQSTDNNQSEAIYIQPIGLQPIEHETVISLMA